MLVARDKSNGLFILTVKRNRVRYTDSALRAMEFADATDFQFFAECEALDASQFELCA